MSNMVEITAGLALDLAGTESKWSEGGEKICADCGRNFDFDDRNEDEEGNSTPLLIWRDEKFMLCFCWRCASLRMQNKDAN